MRKSNPLSLWERVRVRAWLGRNEDAPLHNLDRFGVHLINPGG